MALANEIKNVNYERFYTNYLKCKCKLKYFIASLKKKIKKAYIQLIE